MLLNLWYYEFFTAQNIIYRSNLEFWQFYLYCLYVDNNTLLYRYAEFSQINTRDKSFIIIRNASRHY